MIASIQEALATITDELDSRLQYCQLTAVSLAEERCVLAGSVLDEALLAGVMKRLADRFPGRAWDTTGVTRLRHQDTPRRMIATNLTGLHRTPSRISEMMDQLLYGVDVECLREDQGWTFVRKPNGYLGWVYGRYLADRPQRQPTHVVSRPVSLLHREPDAAAPLAGRLLAGTAVSPAATTATWIQLRLAEDRVGWVPQTDLRALADIPGDENGRRRQMVQDAAQYIGVPYQWGGCSVLGIDCSGLSQLLYHLAGIAIPRDADMQLAAGRPVEPPFRPGDLLFFGSGQGHRRISHVGISLGGWRIIHSSGPRNGVYEDNVQEVSWLRDTFVGATTLP